jgi:hypothetical protein
MNVLETVFLTQHINEYTHKRGNQTPTVIDLILTNEADMVSDVSLHAPIRKSHA